RVAECGETADRDDRQNDIEGAQTRPGTGTLLGSHLAYLLVNKSFNDARNSRSDQKMAEPPSRCNPSGGPMGEGDRRVVRRTDRPMLSAHPWNAPCVKCLCPPWVTAPEKGARTKVHWGTEPNGAGWTWFICIAAV